MIFTCSSSHNTIIIIVIYSSTSTTNPSHFLSLILLILPHDSTLTHSLTASHPSSQPEARSEQALQARKSYYYTSTSSLIAWLAHPTAGPTDHLFSEHYFKCYHVTIILILSTMLKLSHLAGDNSIIFRREEIEREREGRLMLGLIRRNYPKIYS